jgi:outer membrane protein OmpA-like peptidoglycan-associated protein
LGRPLLFVLFLLFLNPSAEGQEVFRYRHQEGDKFRILSQVREEVFINGIFSHRADILNRITMEILGDSGGAGEILGTFLTSERAEGFGGAYTWGREYQSRFFRDSRGLYDIAGEYYMPVVRNVPVFPEEALLPGERWSYPAEEVHDLRNNLNVAEAFHIPIEVNYEYQGPVEEGGKTFHRILIDYRFYYRPEAGRDAGGRNPLRPRLITGYSRQTLLWDNDQGRPESYSEDFDIFFDLVSGLSLEYRGQAEARVVEAQLMDRRRIAEDIQKVLEEGGIGETEVRQGEEGVTISLNNIQFLPDSPELRDEEKVKLARIAAILEAYPGRDILVSGHTALAGAEAGRLALSRERAQAVADYLLQLGCRRPEEIIVQGYGAERPRGDNDTEAGRRLNRRVEITLLEN